MRSLCTMKPVSTGDHPPSGVVDVVGVGVAAQPLVGLEQRHVVGALEQVGGGQPGDARADDGDGRAVLGGVRHWCSSGCAADSVGDRRSAPGRPVGPRRGGHASRTSSRTRLLPLPFDSVPVTLDPTHFGGAEHVGAAVGLLVQPHDVDHPQRVDLAGDRFAAVRIRAWSSSATSRADELDEDLVRPRSPR